MAMGNSWVNCYDRDGGYAGSTPEDAIWLSGVEIIGKKDYDPADWFNGMCEMNRMRWTNLNFSMGSSGGGGGSHGGSGPASSGSGTSTSSSGSIQSMPMPMCPVNRIPELINNMIASGEANMSYIADLVRLYNSVYNVTPPINVEQNSSPIVQSSFHNDKHKNVDAGVNKGGPGGDDPPHGKAADQRIPMQYYRQDVNYSINQLKKNIVPQSGAINKDYTIEAYIFPALAAVKTVVNVANTVNNARIQPPKPDINQIAKDIKEWIGNDVKLYQNKAGEWIFQGKTNRVRMNNLKDHGEPPPFHLQTFNGKDWVDAVPGKHYYFFKNQSW